MKRRKNSWIVLIVIIILVAIKTIGSWRNGRNDHSIVNDDFRNTSHLALTKHARCRMECRHITLEEIKEIIKDGEENPSKSGQGSNGDKTYAIEGYSNQNQHIRVVVASKDNELVVITCIDLDEEWHCNCN